MGNTGNKLKLHKKWYFVYFLAFETMSNKYIEIWSTISTIESVNKLSHAVCLSYVHLKEISFETDLSFGKMAKMTLRLAKLRISQQSWKGIDH